MASHRLESDLECGHHIVMGHWIRCHRDLIAGTENQVGWPGRRDVADLEAPEDDARRQATPDLGRHEFRSARLHN